MAFVLTLAASWCVLLLWAAAVDWRAPLLPATREHLAGDRFHAVFGTAQTRDSRLHVSAAAADFSALQSTALDNLQASDVPVLRYRFDDFPRTLELSLLFRTAAAPDDVQTISLPWPGSGAATFDLSRVPAWNGAIMELGFAQFATAHNVPPELGFRPFDLVEVELWSPSWRGAIGALTTDWFGAWPWSQRSVHALGRDGEVPRSQSAVLVGAIAVALSIGWAALLLGWRSRRMLAASVIATALIWLALDLRWQTGLIQRLLLTRTLYAQQTWPERARIVGDSDVERAAQRVKALLRDEPTPMRILVQAGSRYETLRLIWHLLPLNAAEYTFARQIHARLPDGCLLVFLDSDMWHSDPSLRKQLAGAARVYASAALMADGFEGQGPVVFRYRHAH